MMNSGEIPKRHSGFIINVKKPPNPEAKMEDNFFLFDKIIRRNSCKSVSKEKSPRLQFNDNPVLEKEVNRVFDKSKEKPNGGEYMANKFRAYIKK
jgi:hypothetical protein